MSDRRSPFRRVGDLSRWALSMLEEKRDGQRRLSMSRVAVAVFTAAFVLRFTLPIGWPDAFLGFCVLFAIPIGKALDRAPAADVVKAVTGMFGKPAEAGYFASSSTAWEVGRAIDDPSIPRGSAEVDV